MPSPLDALAMALFTYASHSAAACVLAFVAARLLRRPQDRDIVWKAALIAPVLTTSLALAGSAGRVDLADALRGAVGWILPAREVSIRIMQDYAGRSVVKHLYDPVTTALSTAIAVIAIACMLVAMVRLITRQRARARLLTGRRLTEESLTSDKGKGIRLSEAELLPSPVAIGSNEVCLPADLARDFSEEHRRALIAHEMAHLERRDPAWLFAVEVIGVMTAFQPLVHVVIRSFRRDVELICDEAAVRRTGSGAALIGALARLASPFDARSPLHGAATAHDGSPLVARAERIAALPLDTGLRGARVPALVVAAALVSALLTVPAIASAPRLADLPIEPFQPLIGLPHTERDLQMLDQMGIAVRRRVIRAHATQIIQ